MSRAALWLTAAIVAGCGGAPSVTLHHPDAYPEQLSAWGVVQRQGATIYDEPPASATEKPREKS